MAKDILQKFDFLPIENTNVESANQYIIVNSNKTFLINKVPTKNNQNMQYLTPVPDVKGVLGGLNQVPLYSLTQPPYFVGTASDIVLPEQLVVPNVQETDVFADNYFLPQNADSIITELANVKPTTQFDALDANMQVTIDNPVAGARSTEITLTEEQCQTLEQKGWVLVELNNRVYLVDSVGAHDITDNQKMIERYRDLENNLEKEIEEDLTYIKNLDLMAAQKAHDNVVNAIQAEHSYNYGCTQNGTDLTEDNLPLLTKGNGKVIPKKPKKVKPEKPIRKPRNLLKIPIRTKLVTKDVPSKFYLGTMVNGKKLFARVTKVEGTASAVTKDNNKSTDTCRMVLDLSQTKEDIQQHEYLEYHKEAEYALLRSSTWTEKSGTKEVNAAEKVAERLLAAPRSMEMMQGQRLLITTCERKHKSEDKPEYVLKSVVTGRAVEEQANGGRSKCSFIHMPHLLSYIMKQKTEKYAPHGVENFIIHLHISETFHELLPPQIIVILTKRSMPLKPLTLESILIINESKAKQSCGFCFEVFTSSEDLNKHQKDCSEFKPEDKTSVLEQLMNNSLTAPIISLESKGHKSYACQYCKMKFDRIANYKRHLIIHLGNDYQNTNETYLASESSEDKRENHKCSMCSATFVMSSALTKHIMTTHIST